MLVLNPFLHDKKGNFKGVYPGSTISKAALRCFEKRGLFLVVERPLTIDKALRGPRLDRLGDHVASIEAPAEFKEELDRTFQPFHLMEEWATTGEIIMSDATKLRRKQQREDENERSGSHD